MSHLAVVATLTVLDPVETFSGRKASSAVGVAVVAALSILRLPQIRKPNAPAAGGENAEE